MAEYISSFTTGFAEVVPSIMNRLLPGAKVLNVYDGLVHYLYHGRENQLEKVLIFNNTFLVIRKYRGAGCELSRMINDVLAFDHLSGTPKESFRIRYSVNNQFVAVNRKYTARIEEKICRLTRGRVDRVSPQTEYWFLQRSENVGFFCRLTGRRKSTEKNLHKGELRPEIAYLICSYAGIQPEDIILEPFCGYGSIPIQLEKRFTCAKIFVSNIDKEKIEKLTLRQAQGPHTTVVVPEPSLS